MEAGLQLDVLQTARCYGLSTKSDQHDVVFSETGLSQSHGADNPAPPQSSTASISTSEKQMEDDDPCALHSLPRHVMSPSINDAGEFIPTAVVIKNIPSTLKKRCLQSIMEDMGLPLPSPFTYHFDNGAFSGIAYGSFKTGEDTNSVVEKMNCMKLLGQELRVEHETIFSVLERENIEIQNLELSGDYGGRKSVIGRKTCAYSIPSKAQFHNGEPSGPPRWKQARSASISSDSHFEAAKLSNPIYQKWKGSAPSDKPSDSILRQSTQILPFEDLPPKERLLCTWKPAKEILGDNPVHPSIDRKGKAKYDERKVDSSLDQTKLPASPEELLNPEEFEFIKASEESEGRPFRKEFLDFGEFSRVRMYNYYVSRLNSTRITCDGVQKILGSPAQSPDDLALLKTLTRHHSSRRWWRILINDLAFEECVTHLRHRREKPKFDHRRFWLSIKNQVKRICRCQNYDYDLVCTHRSSSRLDRLFRTLGKRNATRIINVELQTVRWSSVDPEILASAVHNLEFYMTNLQSLSIQFHFCEGVPVKPDLVKRVVCLLAKIESLLPWRQRLMVYGFEAHEECQIAWSEKSRKWYE